MNWARVSNREDTPGYSRSDSSGRASVLTAERERRRPEGALNQRRQASVCHRHWTHRDRPEALRICSTYHHQKRPPRVADAGKYSLNFRRVALSKVATSINGMADMKSRTKALLIVVAMVFGCYASQTLASETPPMASDSQDDCVVDEQIECAERCLTEKNCCIKSCNWVEPKAKSTCIEHCKVSLEKCYQECDKKPAADQATKRPPEPGTL